MRQIPKAAWLFLLVPAAIVLAVVLALRSAAEWPVEEFDQGVVETYCRLVAEKRYADAYEQCLTASYRKEVPLAHFAEAHARLRDERGPLQAREVVRINASRNLFSKTRTFQILYRLDYAGGEWRNYLVVDDADGEWRIDGTYVRGAGQGLNFLIW